MGYNNSNNYNNSNQKNLKARHQIEVYLKEKLTSKGNVYLQGYHPSVGKVTIFTGFNSDKGYVGKVGMTANNLHR